MKKQHQDLYLYLYLPAITSMPCAERDSKQRLGKFRAHGSAVARASDSLNDCRRRLLRWPPVHAIHTALRAVA